MKPLQRIGRLTGREVALTVYSTLNENVTRHTKKESDVHCVNSGLR